MNSHEEDLPNAGIRPDRVAVQTEPEVAYHRLARLRPRYRWWRMLLTGLLGAVIYAVLLTLLVVVPVVAAGALVPEWGIDLDAMLSSTRNLELDQPWIFVAYVVPLILMIPSLLLASRIVEGRGIGLLSSAVGRLRWAWLVRCAVLALVIFLAYFAIEFGVAAARGALPAPDFSHPRLWLGLLLILALVPLQAAAEEYVFRGYLMQLVGGWLRHPAFAILLPVPLFVAGHGYDVWGALDVGFFAIAAAWLTWRTGGLEAAIGLHVVNNVLVLLVDALGMVDQDAESGSALGLLAIIVATVAYALLADRWATRLGVARTRPAQAASSASASMIV